MNKSATKQQSEAPRNYGAHLPDIGGHRLGRGAVTGITAIAAQGIVLVVSKMMAHFGPNPNPRGPHAEPLVDDGLRMTL